MYQVTQRSSLNDVLTLSSVTTMLQIERGARARDNRRIDRVASELHAIAERTGASLGHRAVGCTVMH